MFTRAILVGAIALTGFAAAGRAQDAGQPPAPSPTLTGKAAFGSWRDDAPGQAASYHRGCAAGSQRNAFLAQPGSCSGQTAGRAAQGARLGSRSSNSPAGSSSPALMRVAPNGDIFVAESGAGRIRVLRPDDSGDRRRQERDVRDRPRPSVRDRVLSGRQSAMGLCRATPIRWSASPTAPGDLKASGRPEVVVAKLPSGGSHSTRDVVFSKDGTQDVRVGRLRLQCRRRHGQARRRGAAQMGAGEAARARPGATRPIAPTCWCSTRKARTEKVYATGIRNCVGMAVNPTTGDLWCSTNERDVLGDDLVPDYITRVREGALLRLALVLHRRARRPAPQGRAARPQGQGHGAGYPDAAAFGLARDDVLHRRPVPGRVQGQRLRGRARLLEPRDPHRLQDHPRASSKDGVPTGEYEDFVTGFVVDDSAVWGRPVGVAQAQGRLAPVLRGRQRHDLARRTPRARLGALKPDFARVPSALQAASMRADGMMTVDTRCGPGRPRSSGRGRASAGAGRPRRLPDRDRLRARRRREQRRRGRAALRGQGPPIVQSADRACA